MTNRTPFQAVMNEVLSEVGAQEALSFKVLAAMVDMESTFHLEWLKDYWSRKSERGYQAEKIRTVLEELLGDTYSTILEDCKLKSKEPDDVYKKQLAQKKRINLDNRIRMCLEAIVFFRVKPLNKEGLKINNQTKTASFGTEEGVQYKRLTFTDILDMSRSVIASQGWVQESPSKPKTTQLVKDHTPKTTEGNDALLEATLQATIDLIRSTDIDSASPEAIKAMIQLAKITLKKAFGDPKRNGKIILDDLSIDFAGMFTRRDGSVIPLIEVPKAA